MRRRDIPKQDKFRLEGEDIRERKELQAYVVMAIAAEICKLTPAELADGSRWADPDAQKAEEARQEGEARYVNAPGQGNRHQPQNDRRDRPGR
jgi:peptide-N4-(N-acetyl-beta-glucosaminyl)asparagine amidase